MWNFCCGWTVQYPTYLAWHSGQKADRTHRVITISKHLTSQENLALNLIFGCLGESRFNRTPEEYEAIISKLPPLKVLHADINDRLKDWAEAGFAPYEICYFRAGDEHIWYESFPKSLSIETCRSALVKSGMRKKRPRRSRAPCKS